MLKIVVPGDEFYDEDTNEFSTQGDVTLILEHSLVSLSKWEAITNKPFLAPGEKSDEEIKIYIECMITSSEFPPNFFSKLSEENIEQINEYVDAKMTATWFTTKPGKQSTEVITSEVIYYWLTVFSIPFEVENWHLNRLLTLIRVCNEKSKKPTKMSRNETLARQRELNALRRAQSGSKG